MSPFHTPQCRAVWTEVWSGGVLRNLVLRDQELDLRVGWEIDPALIALPIPAYWHWTFELVAQNSVLAPEFDTLEVSGGTGFLKDLPGPSLWNYRVWNRADDLVTDPEATWFVFRPHLYIYPAGKYHEFAFPEEPHYILFN
jgi:hypothetical protein